MKRMILIAIAVMCVALKPARLAAGAGRVKLPGKAIGYSEMVKGLQQMESKCWCQ